MLTGRGRSLGLAALAAGVVAVTPAAGQAPGSDGPRGDSTRRAAGAHADLACAACHRGRSAGREVGAVPAESCTAADCHPSGGPDRVRVSTVTFRHRGHADTASVEPGCAGCHGHASGGAPIRPTLDACGLCHAAEISGRQPRACRSCHQRPVHVPTTNQGVPIPHGELPWIVEGCTRCHYDVARPQTGVSVARCRDCHAELERVTRDGIGRDLHPEHTGVGCTTCHARGTHELQAISSSVVLECSACHRRAHDVEPDSAAGRPGGVPPSAVCTDCHRDTHADQQRMVLGIVRGRPVTPAYKFLSGLTCGSCHVGAGGGTDAAAEPTPGTTADACVACHRPEYREVVRWWEEGTEQRVRRASRYRERAGTVLAPVEEDSARRYLEEAERLVAMVERGGGAHNLQLADDMLRHSVDLVRRAYELEERRPPEGPSMGRRPRVGFCSYCHYRVGEPGITDRIPEDFHRELEDRFRRLRDRP